VRHTRIALMSAEGISNQFIAERCGVNVPTIKRFGGAAAPGSKIYLTTRLERVCRHLKTGQNWHFDPAKWAACRLLRNPWSSIGDHQEEQPNY
jgi:hypothetical protein